MVRKSGKTQGRGIVESRSSAAGRPRSLPRSLLLGAGVLVVLGFLAAAYTEPGRMASAYAFVVLEFYAGVFVLITLSLAVMAGVFATDRTILQIRHRVMLQAFHRAMSVIAVSFLGVHIAVKVLGGRAGLLDAFVPFASPELSIFVGFGAVACYLLLISFWTGVIRARFAGKSRPWLWRILHCSAYASWPVALAHGLNAGRPGATWVTVSYVACVGAVVIGLLVRLYVTFGRRSSGVRTSAPAVGVAVRTAIVPRILEPVVPPVSAPASLRSIERDVHGRAERWEGQLAQDPRWDEERRAARRWEEEPGAARWRDGQSTSAAAWGEPPAVELDLPERELEPPRRLRLINNDRPAEPRSGAPQVDSRNARGGPYVQAGRWEWDQRGGDNHPESGYERPGPYPPALSAGSRTGRRDSRGPVEQSVRRGRGRRVAGDDVAVEHWNYG